LSLATFLGNIFKNSSGHRGQDPVPRPLYLQLHHSRYNTLAVVFLKIT
jgi:hypothetical protein